jgi:dihydrofolate synthase/folylpolyglutamate synthase
VSDGVVQPYDGWSSEDAERFLLARERFGMRFGLDRIHRLLNVLELGRIPFPSIHIVGTNGKSSTTRMIAALLERHGLRTGCFTSPHLLSYRERIRVAERDIAPSRFAQQIARTVHAADLVDRSQNDPAGDVVTQFELLTAAALCEFAAPRCRCGGARGGPRRPLRRDQRGRLARRGADERRARAHALPRPDGESDIAREKLDVVRPGATLSSARPGSGALVLAEQTASERGATLVQAAAEAGATSSCGPGGGYQRRNFAVALRGVRAFLGYEPTQRSVCVAAASSPCRVASRCTTASRCTLLDGAHNDGGIEALSASLPEFARRAYARQRWFRSSTTRTLAAMLGALLVALRRACLHGVRKPACAAGGDARLARRSSSGARADVRRGRAAQRALALAREMAGSDGVVLATGSIYLLADLLRDPRAGLALNGI